MSQTLDTQEKERLLELMEATQELLRRLDQEDKQGSRFPWALRQRITERLPMVEWLAGTPLKPIEGLLDRVRRDIEEIDAYLEQYGYHAVWDPQEGDGWSFQKNG